MSGDTWGKEDLTLEKLKIVHRLETIENAIMEDKEDTKAFRSELKDMMKTQQAILFGDGEAKKGLVTRVNELESVRGIHSKVMWGIGLPAIGLAVKSVWDLITGAKPH